MLTRARRSRSDCLRTLPWTTVTVVQCGVEVEIEVEVDVEGGDESYLLRLKLRPVVHQRVKAVQVHVLQLHLLVGAVGVL